MDLRLEVNLGSKAVHFVSDNTMTRTLPSVKDTMMVDDVSGLNVWIAFCTAPNPGPSYSLPKYNV